MTRERAALGDDAAQFASADGNAATVEDGEDDLLGGGGSYSGGHKGGEEITEFESSFPAMDTQNEVSWIAKSLRYILWSIANELLRALVPVAQSPAQAFLSSQANISHPTADMERR